MSQKISKGSLHLSHFKNNPLIIKYLVNVEIFIV